MSVLAIYSLAKTTCRWRGGEVKARYTAFDREKEKEREKEGGMEGERECCTFLVS